jgi:hypothetical protein
MSVRIHETGENHAPAEIESFGAPRIAQPLDAAPWANGGDAVVTNKQRTIADDAKIGEIPAAPGDSAAQSKQLGTAGNQPIRHGKYRNSNSVR